MARPPNRIREHRTFLGLSAEQLGARVGLAQSQISRLELGKQALTADLMYQIALGLGVPPGALIGEPDNINKVVIGDLRGGGRLYEFTDRKFVPLPPTQDISFAFETERGWLVAVDRAPEFTDDGKLFVVHFKRGEELRLELRTFEKEGGGYSARTGAPVDRWLPVSDKRILHVWRITAEFRTI